MSLLVKIVAQEKMFDIARISNNIVYVWVPEYRKFVYDHNYTIDWNYSRDYEYVVLTLDEATSLIKTLPHCIQYSSYYRGVSDTLPGLAEMRESPRL